MAKKTMGYENLYIHKSSDRDSDIALCSLSLLLRVERVWLVRKPNIDKKQTSHDALSNLLPLIV